MLGDPRTPGGRVRIRAAESTPKSEARRTFAALSRLKSGHFEEMSAAQSSFRSLRGDDGDAFSPKTPKRKGGAERDGRTPKTTRFRFHDRERLASKDLSSEDPPVSPRTPKRKTRSFSGDHDDPRSPKTPKTPKTPKVLSAMRDTVASALRAASRTPRASDREAPPVGQVPAAQKEKEPQVPAARRTIFASGFEATAPPRRRRSVHDARRLDVESVAFKEFSKEVRDDAEMLVTSGAVMDRVDARDLVAERVPIERQGNLALYSDAEMVKRVRVEQDPRFEGLCRTLWALVATGNDGKVTGGCLQHKEYVEMVTRFNYVRAAGPRKKERKGASMGLSGGRDRRCRGKRPRRTRPSKRDD